MNIFLNSLINSINVGLMIYTLYLFFDNFSIGRINHVRQGFLILSTGIVSVLILTFTSVGIVRTVLFISIPFLLSFIFKLKWYNHILLSLLIFALQTVCELITTISFSILFHIDTQTALEGMFQILGIVLSKMFMLLLLVVMKISKYKLAYSLTIPKCLSLLLMPLATIIISLVHINWYVQYPIQSLSTTWFSLFSYIVLILSNIAVFYLIDRSYKEAEKDKQLTLVTGLLTAQVAQYEQLQTHNQEILKIRHDHKNFILGLVTELDNQNYDGIRTTLLSEYECLSQPSELDTKHSVIATVVKMKSAYAKTLGITIDFEYHELHKINISAIDIAIILGNALDNAIEAVERVEDTDKHINILAKVNHNVIVIIIKNPVAETVNPERMISTKRGDGSFGYGVESMKRLAKKHDGEIIFTCENRVFETNIVIRNPNE